MEKKILAIDDETIVLELLVDMLSESGFQVITAESGRSGLDLFSRADCRFDLVITDLSLPDMTGFEVCRELRQINPAPIIMIATGRYVTDEEISELKQNGIENIIRKPFNLNELISLLRSELGCS